MTIATYHVTLPRGNQRRSTHWSSWPLLAALFILVVLIIGPFLLAELMIQRAREMYLSSASSRTPMNWTYTQADPRDMYVIPIQQNA